ncbi:ATP-dependent Clp protease adaptor ClpS [Clostridium thailandense]|uniref:ATP-dependent Clp protease adaptor ClpS n=1 Tax=Clostridium thailandense TaxID=2794346 RepID=UPI00398973D8
MSQKFDFKEETKIKFAKPKMYKVLIHNDDYTTMDFVIKVLVKVFKKEVVEATQIMYDVHKKGVGVAGIYSYDIAATKTVQAMTMAEESGFPLKFSMEEE